MTESGAIDGLDQEQLGIGLSDNSAPSDGIPINIATFPLQAPANEEEESVEEPLKPAPPPPDVPGPLADQPESGESAPVLSSPTPEVAPAGDLEPGPAAADDSEPEQQNSDGPQEISEPAAADQRQATPPRHTELEPIPDESELESLQREQEEAIEALDFQLARSIQTRIDNLNTAGAFSVIDEKSAELRRAVDHLAGAWRRNREHLIQKFHVLEFNERTRADTEFGQLRNRHLGELTDLKSKLFDEYKRDMSKPIPKYDDLLEQARGNAVRADFDRAQKNQEDAERVLHEERDRREATFRKSYKSQLRNLLARQGVEVEGLAKRTRDGVGDLEKRRTKEIGDNTSTFRRKLEREYKWAVDCIANRARVSPRKTPAGPVITDRKAVAELLNALEDTFRAALVRYGLAASEDGARPRLLVPHTRIESQMSLRMQSRISTREQTKSAPQNKTEKKELGTARSAPRSKGHE
jgi:hypothetical protein